jgi:hypothetical protein
MWDVLERLEGWLVICRDRGWGFWRPVNVRPRGADWMTLSFANCSWDGATMVRPGGALFRRDIPGVFAAKCPTLSLSLSAPSPFADCCCNLDSMICLWCSRTLMLRCNCSFITGSWVTNPGDKHARPTSWIPRPPSLPVSGPRPVAEVVFVFFDRSSFRGRWRAVGRSGEDGSFFTMIFGGPPAFRELQIEPRLR